MRKTKYIKLAMYVMVLIAGSMNVRGDVVDSSTLGFTSKNTLNISAPPKEVYRHLITNIGHWWNPEHTYSGVSQNLYIEPKATGCFCERLNDGGSIQHLTVVYVEPNKTIRMNGALGPLQPMAVAGSFTLSLSEVAGSTKIEATYAAGGYHPKGFQGLAPLVDKVLLLQLTRLKNYVETGKP
jgi:uncharacterized protein YndB with AHSA1/START domain